ncbi:hypothetical protein CPB86DRAFT_694841 [Serendipita vermifera]|nr:hypothetical protein CPB86DRAFT_694841 [Serendipita vermifera]
MSTSSDETSSDIETRKDEIMRINTNVDPRMFLLPAIGATTGLALGLFRGAGNAKLRYIAENAHKRPTTVRGWYFYNKTKNYQMMWAGLKEGSKEAVKLASMGLLWAGIEEVVKQYAPSLEPEKEFVAGLGTAATFSAITRLGARTASRVLILGGLTGGIMSMLRAGQSRVGTRIKQQNADAGGPGS